MSNEPGGIAYGFLRSLKIMASERCKSVTRVAVLRFPDAIICVLTIVKHHIYNNVYWEVILYDE